MESIHQQLDTQEGFLRFRNPVSPTASLAVVGDLAFHGPLIEKIKSTNSDFIFSSVQERLKAADISVGNLESVLIPHPFSPLSQKACLVSGFEAMQKLKEAGFDVLTLANNHVMDAGPDGLLDCLDGLADANIPTTGAGRTVDEARQPVRIRKGDLSFVFFAYSYGCGQIVEPNRPGCNESNLKNILADVQAFSTETDIKVVCLHMDAEFQATPAPDRIVFCRKLADSGIQMVFCHHPHVPQGLEFYNGTLIAYSLGNFVFPMIPYLTAASPDCDKSFLLEVEVDTRGASSARVVPVVLGEHGQPVQPPPEVRSEVLAMVARRSAMLEDSSAVRGNYRRMIDLYTRDLIRNTYWAIGERDWKRAKLYLASLRFSPTNRRWVRHYFQYKIFGR
jgi:poly-gamma-glutamate capsule biosynthesis protein CapA/YwtB (metallophosphatase superfamily)